MYCKDEGLKVIASLFLSVHPTNWISTVDRILKQQEAEREAAAKALVVKKAEPASVPKITIVHIPIPGSDRTQPPETPDTVSQVPQVPTIPVVRSPYVGELFP